MWYTAAKHEGCVTSIVVTKLLKEKQTLKKSCIIFFLSASCTWPSVNLFTVSLIYLWCQDMTHVVFWDACYFSYHTHDYVVIFVTTIIFKSRSKLFSLCALVLYNSRELLEWNGYEIKDDVLIHPRVDIDNISIDTDTDNDWTEDVHDVKRFIT